MTVCWNQLIGTTLFVRGRDSLRLVPVMSVAGCRSSVHCMKPLVSLLTAQRLVLPLHSLRQRRQLSALPSEVNGLVPTVKQRWRRRVLTVLDSKVEDVFKLRQLEDVLRETTLLLQLHSDKMTGRNLSALVSQLSRRHGFVLDDQTAVLLAHALETVHMDTHQAFDCLSLLLCIETETAAVTELIDALCFAVKHSRGELAPSLASRGLHCLRFLEVSPAVERLLSALSRRVVLCEEAMSSTEICLATHGLRKATEFTPGVSDLLSYLARQLEGTESITERDLHKALGGLKIMRAVIPEVRAFLRALIDAVRRSPLSLPASLFGMAVYRTKNMTSNCSVVRELLAALLSKLSTDDETLRPGFGAVTSTILGLGNKRDDYEVRAVLKVVARWIMVSEEEHSMRALMICFECLRNMDMRAAESRLVLRSLCQRLELAGSAIAPSYAGTILCCMDHMTAEMPEVRWLLRIVHDILARHQGRITVALNCLHGFQQMGSYRVEAQQLLDIIPDKLDIVREDTPIHLIGLALFGLRNCELGAKWAPILRLWFQRLFGYLETGILTNMLHELEPFPLQKLLILFHSNCALLDAVVKYKLLMDWIKIKVLLRDNLQECTYSMRPVIHHQERDFAVAIDEIIRGYVEVLETQYNTLLYGFEADMVVKYVMANGETAVLDIEIDGPSHGIARKRYFCSLRDELLEREFGVRVLRVATGSRLSKSKRIRDRFREYVLNLLCSMDMKSSQGRSKYTVPQSLV